MKNNRILIIQTAFLGDVILALPMAQTLKNHLPGSLIDMLVIPGTANVLENHPAVNKVIQYDKKGGDKLDKFIEALSEVREEEYDVVITPHRFTRSALLTYWSEAKTRIGFRQNALSFLLTAKAEYVKDRHEIYRNLELVKLVPGLEYDESKVSMKPDLYPSAEQKEKVRQMLNRTNLVSFAPCSKWYTKQLTIEKSAEIARLLLNSGYSVALLGGGSDTGYCSELESIIKDDELLNLCGKTVPLESYEVMCRSKAVITTDSAAQHLAAASGKPIVLVYGSTDMSFGFYPLTSKNAIAENNGLECRPCTDHGRDKCPLGHFKCMVDLDAKRIVGMMEEILR